MAAASVPASQRALADQGLGLQLNLETFGSELQLAWSPRAGVSAWCRRRPGA